MTPQDRPEPDAPAPVPEPQGLTYTRLTSEDQAEILSGRLRQLEAEHFNHETNRRLGEAAGSAEIVDGSKRALHTIEQAHAQIVAQLAEIAG